MRALSTILCTTENHIRLKYSSFDNTDIRNVFHINLERPLSLTLMHWYQLKNTLFQLYQCVSQKKVTLCTFFTRNHTPKLDETVEEHHHIGKEEQYYGAFIFKTISFHLYFDSRSWLFIWLSLISWGKNENFDIFFHEKLRVNTEQQVMSFIISI